MQQWDTTWVSGVESMAVKCVTEQPVRSAWTAALWLCKETCLCVGSTKGRCEGRTLKHAGMSPENCVPSFLFVCDCLKNVTSTTFSN